MPLINKQDTTVLNTFGNGTGYIEGISQNLYEGGQQNFNNGNTSVADSQKDFLSKLYSYNVKADEFTTTVSSAPWSIANKFALFTYNGFHGNSMNILKNNYLNAVDNPLMGGEFARDPNPSKLVEYFRDLPVKYEYSDFLWCKHADYIQNNNMFTLRRFATPVEDNIFSRLKTIYKDDELKSTETYKDIKPDISRAVGYFGESTGNVLQDLLSFTYGYKWKTQTAETNTHEVGSDRSYTTHPFYERLASTGAGGMLKAGVDVLTKTSASDKYKRSHMAGFDPYATTYPNFVIGPVNVINEMQTRDVGLNFEQDIKLTFEYDLKGRGNINPKVALLDIMANLLVLTYDNANFWGGANRFYGGSGYVAPRFGNDQELRKGNFRGYLNSLVNDLGGGFKKAFFNQSGEPTIESVFNGLKNVGGTFFGNFLGNMINNQLGAPPAMMQLKGMITGEATGNWHLTVGNPLNPIALIGNLALVSSNISFVGPLGYDDFPSGIKLEVTLKHARPRDKTDFESMFNAGKGRLYAGAYGEGDVLNLIGNDVKVYGAFQGDSKRMKKAEYNAFKNLPYESKAEAYKSSDASSDYKKAADLASAFINN